MLNLLKHTLRKTCAGVTLLCLAAAIQPANAGTIILEGSDAIGYHSNSVADAGLYRDQVWTALGGSSPKSIAVIGGSVSAGVIGSNTHAISRFSTVADAGSLGDYVALYFLAGGGCCEQDDSLITALGAATAVGAYLTGGGTVMIENYTGGSAWDFAVGAGGNGNAHVAGYAGGLSGATCSDGETVTADGLLNGFTQPGVLGCWTHQAYDVDFFGALGFTHTFFDGGPDYPARFSSLLSTGFTTTGIDNGGGSVPEPSSMILIASAMLALGAISRRRSSQR